MMSTQDKVAEDSKLRQNLHEDLQLRLSLVGATSVYGFVAMSAHVHLFKVASLV